MKGLLIQTSDVWGGTNVEVQFIWTSTVVEVQVLYLQMCCVQFKVRRKMNVFNERVLLNSFMHNTGSDLGFFKMGVTAAILRAGGTTPELRLELTSNVNGSH